MKILIEVMRGVVVGVSSTEDAEFFVLDHDNLEQMVDKDEVARHFSSFSSTDIMSKEIMDRNLKEQLDKYSERVESFNV